MSNEWRRKTVEVYPNQVRQCPYCLTSIGFHKLKSGKWTPVELITKRDQPGRLFRPAGSGNNFNFVPIHDCRRDAEQRFERLSEEVQKMQGANLKNLREAILGSRKDRRALSIEARSLMAKNLRLCKQHLRAMTPQLKSLEEQLDFTVQLATMTADWQREMASSI